MKDMTPTYVFDRLSPSWDRVRITPPAWTNLPSHVMALTKEQSSKLQEWLGNRDAKLREAIPDLTEDQVVMVMTGVTRDQVVSILSRVLGRRVSRDPHKMAAEWFGGF